MTAIPTSSEEKDKCNSPLFSQDDVIQLSLPINPAYVSAVRLTASSVANRLGFDVDEIEDVKAAVSEACTFLIKKKPSSLNDEYSISFHLNKDLLYIDIKCGFDISGDTIDSEMGLLMIKTLMDKFVINCDTGRGSVIYMEKKHKEMFLD